MKADIRLRQARDGDAAEVAEVLIASRGAYQPFAPMAHSGDEVRHWVASHLVPTGNVTVAMCEAQVVGVLATSFDGRCAWIDQLFVRPGWLRQGIGTALLDHAHATLPRPLRLYTFQANAGARSFYERHGYRAIAFSDGATNEEHCPDVLYELA